MDLLPAIDLRHGQVVRLRQGDDARATAYASDPLAVAAAFAAAGVRRIHVVDLDAALGEPPQRDLVTRLLGALAEPAAPRWDAAQVGRGGAGGASDPDRAGGAGGPGGAGRARGAGRVVGIQLGGGLRDRAAVEWALAAGCERVVMASLPAREPGRFAALAREFPGRLLPAVEVAHGEPRVAGWTRAAGSGLDELCSRLRGLPCPAVLVTDVERDGMLCGPNFELACSVGDATGLPALLSGGVRTLADLATAAGLPAIGGAILGRALYEHQIDLAAALAVCRRGAGAAVAADGRPAPGSELARSMP